ncbi:arsenosugar biosynthesis radical SAM protein ArsS [Geomonas sp. RF6]|uniref:arsenosugar biosynthesis radical SAM (seleno)protein ArsS n=1 Tax=Geomonas sp. RF6 TaxID=2897342 RepID=UPI001E5C49CC|nr:arsenosugar biosynthesis radical SAM (seleno)protein ArsS [Geomonas sp. RF6]UFS71071.1 arsenosugar biosynthesis radical SAM protein ArsS [Geomonas sp. RF6]
MPDKIVKQDPPETFAQTLVRHGVELTRDRTVTLQVNTGRLCSLSCRHCHLEAGPGRGETMTRETMDSVIDAARRLPFASIDITGGAPELVPDLEYLLRGVAPLAPRVVVRTNLVSLDERLARLYRELRVVLVASFPALNAGQTSAQRGEGVWEKSIEALKLLNSVGYGVPGEGVELDLVSNPSGAFLPAAQAGSEKRFRAELSRRYGVSFDNLFCFANVPLGRFLAWLEKSGNLEGYREKLAAGFNPCAVAGLMCRSQLSVDWDGALYDCDFHLAAGIPFGGGVANIRELQELPAPGTPIPTAQYCFACTVGSGFT